VQLKPGLVFDKKYCGKNLHIAFLAGGDCYVFPHDELLDAVLLRGQIGETTSWKIGGKYSWPSLPAWARELLAKHKI
jgi:hypothetical protein